MNKTAVQSTITLKLLLTVFLLNNVNCQDRHSCLEMEMKRFKEDSIYSTVENEFRDTLQSWISQGVRTVQSFQRIGKDNWKINAILFNSIQQKGIISVLEVDNDQVSSFDNVLLYGFERDNDSWKFYSGGFPNIAVDREGNDEKAHSFEQLSEIFERYVIDMGIIELDSCKISDSVIDKFFNSEYKEVHNRFLNDK